MKKAVFILATIILIFTANAFGQNQRKKRNFYNLPEVEDEVLVAFRKKKLNKKVSNSRKSSKRKVKTIWDDTDIVHRQNQKNKTRKTRRTK